MRNVSRKWFLRLSAATAVTVGCGGFYTYYYVPGKTNASPGVLNEYSFTPFTLVAKEKVSSTSSILRLRPKLIGGQDATKSSSIIGELWKAGIWSIEIKQPQLMIARRYTPLPSFETDHELGRLDKPDPGPADLTKLASGPEVISLLIRREPQGEVSRYLHSIPIDGNVEVRGGFVEHRIPQDVREVLFLAGGTGIATALQVARCLQERGHPARMTVLWANRSRDDCIGGVNPEAVESAKTQTSWFSWSKQGPSQAAATEKTHSLAEKSIIVRQLDALSSAAHPDGFTFMARYFVDEEGDRITTKEISRFSSRDRASDEGSDRRLILISGPEGFVSYLAGPKHLANGIETQGSLGGLLSGLDTRGWDVVKL